MNYKIYTLSVVATASLFAVGGGFNYKPITGPINVIKAEQPKLMLDIPMIEVSPSRFQVEPSVIFESLVVEPDLITPMVENTAIQKSDAELALQVAKTYDHYEEVFLLQMVVMKIESDFVHLDMNQSGDVGIMQLNNATWEGHRKRLGDDWNPYDRLDNIIAGTHEILQCVKQAYERHPEDWVRWSYIYYNRGKSVEVSNKWKDESFRHTSFVRADKFQHYYDLYRSYFEIF